MFTGIRFKWTTARPPTLAQVEEMYIKAMQDYGSGPKETAYILGISVRTLYTRLKEYKNK